MHLSSRVLAIASSSLVLAATANLAYASHSWGFYHWARTGNPFTVKLGDNLTSAWDPYLATTSSDWSVSSILDTTIVPGVNPRPKSCKPALGRVEICNTTYGSNGWLGIAQIWINGDHITQSVVKMNDTYFKMAKYNKPAWKNLVLCQEVGHAFGLDHQDENFGNLPLGTCMDYSNDPVPNQHPNAHDYEELEEIYAHLDGSTTLSAVSPSTSNPSDLDDPAAWGKAQRTSSDGKGIVYERDLSDGHKVVTFVIWAEEPRGNGRSH
jgi:hypothetical protein